MKKLLLIPLFLLMGSKDKSPNELARISFRQGYILGLKCAKQPDYLQGHIWLEDSLKFEITINQ